MDPMDERNPPSPGQDGPPVPRDLPDQQASDERDPWEVDEKASTTGNSPDDADEDVPDTDEAGTGRRGSAEAETSPTEDPEPQEPTA
ncbi:hypothetical protein [Streptomyces sp. NPDC017988]|uniref:hypothetical protein n=1 Tax=Streptomyces sp. NPDC017988 TaxID=3365025 RepID=UPI0037B6E5E2